MDQNSMHVLRYFILIVLMCIQAQILSMYHTSPQSKPCENLPEEVWKQIFVWMNYREDNIRSERVRSDEKLLFLVASINNLVRYSRLCKSMHRASAPLITAYLQWAADYVKYNDMHSLLFRGLAAGTYDEERLAPLYRK